MEAKEFDEQLLERSYKELTKLTKELNMTKRIKAKKGHLRGAAWHAAREAKASWKVQKQADKLVASLSEPEPVNQAGQSLPRVWFKIWELKEPGLYVASTSEGLVVVRAIFSDDGVQKTTDIVDAVTRSKLHGAVVAQSAFQKIKE